MTIPSIKLMQSRTDNFPSQISAKTFAICLLLTCSLQIMENLLPKVPIFPWLRLGLAYWVLLPFLIRFGLMQMLALFVFRNLVTLIYGGQVFSAFLISTSAGVFSLILIGHLGRWLYLQQKLGLVGLSVALACGFNISQLIIVDRLFIQHQEFYFQLAPILFWSLISGVFIAILVYKSSTTLEQLFTFELKVSQTEQSKSNKSATFNLIDLIGGLISLSLFSAILILDEILYQCALLILVLIFSRFRKIKILLFAWPFYFYIAWLHLFQTDGVYLLGELITKEGVNAFVFYSLRTTSIILSGQLLGRYVPKVLSKFRPNRYLEGMRYALPILPALFGISIALGKDLFQKIKTRQWENLLDPVIERLVAEFENLDRS